MRNFIASLIAVVVLALTAAASSVASGGSPNVPCGSGSCSGGGSPPYSCGGTGTLGTVIYWNGYIWKCYVDGWHVVAQ